MALVLYVAAAVAAVVVSAAVAAAVAAATAAVVVVVVAAAAAVHTPIPSVASVYYDRPNAMTAVIRMMEYDGFG